MQFYTYYYSYISYLYFCFLVFFRFFAQKSLRLASLQMPGSFGRTPRRFFQGWMWVCCVCYFSGTHIGYEWIWWHILVLHGFASKIWDFKLRFSDSIKGCQRHFVGSIVGGVGVLWAQLVTMSRQVCVTVWHTVKSELTLLSQCATCRDETWSADSRYDRSNHLSF